jgi:hypothetical protein
MEARVAWLPQQQIRSRLSEQLRRKLETLLSNSPGSFEETTFIPEAFGQAVRMRDR